MGGQRNNLTELRKIIPDPYQQAVGLVPTVSTYVDERGLTQYIYTLQPVAPGSAQTKIQFQYNGGNLGTAGTVDTVNVASSWATFARASNTVTLTIPTPVQSLNSLTGVLSVTSLDGSVTILASGSTVDLSTSGGSLIRARVATAAALPANTYSNGASGVGATLTGVAVGALTIDGVAVALSDVVLVQSEVTQSHNGVYVVTTLGTVGVAYVLTRDPRMNQSSEFTGALVTTGPDGTANKDMTFECTAVSPVTVGTTAITFQSVSSGVTSPLTTKGDLWGYSTVNARVPVGANDLPLVADSGAALGVSYKTLPIAGGGTNATTAAAARTNLGTQALIQIQDSGVNQGSAGDATTYNFTGGISAVVSAGVATLDVSGYPDVANLCGGTGETGNVDLDGTNTFSFLSKSGNDYTVNATTNLAIARLRITTGCTLSFAGGKASVQQWVCTSGFYGKIVMDGGNGTNAVGSAAGTAGGAKVTATDYFAAGTAGSNGSASTTTNSASTGSSTGSSQAYGGAGTRGGQGGNGSPGNAGTTGTAGTASGYQPMGGQFQLLRTNSGAAWTAGFGGSGGTGGGGDNTNAGGGGGGGGGGGSGLDISVGEIVTDASTPGGLLTSNGGNGGNGATATLGNTGGGGGGGAGGGGAIRLVLGKRTGPAVVGFMTANGGKGGNAGALHGTGQNGVAASGGSNGRLFLYNGAATTWAIVATVSAGSAASGLTGGAGATASVDL